MTDAIPPSLLGGLAERWHERRGVRVRCFVGGDGPPLLLVHGYSGAAWNFAELAPRLSGRRLLIPDLPGHGASSPLPAARTLSAYADVLAAVCEAEDARSVDVFGHSLGGVVALRLAERAPRLVRRLILAAPAGISTSTRRSEAFITAVGLVKPARLASRHVDRIARSPLLRKVVFGLLEVSNSEALSPRAVHAFLRASPLHTDALGAGLALAAGDPRRDLDRVRCPVLVLWGARDRQVPLEDGFEYARRLHAPLRVVADCGHLLIGERPDACARAIEDFLSEGEARGGNAVSPAL